MLTFITASKKGTLDNAVLPLELNVDTGYHIIKTYQVTPDVLPEFKPGHTYLGMGDHVLSLLQKAKIVPSGRTVGSLRTRTFKVHQMFDMPIIQAFKLPMKITRGLEKSKCKGYGKKFTTIRVPRPESYATVLVTHSPGIEYTDYRKGYDVKWDIQLAARVEATGSVLPVLGTYEWVEDYTYLGREIVAEYKRTGKPVAISVDLETNGLSAFYNYSRIVSISVSHKEGYSALISFPDNNDTLSEKLFKQIDFLMNNNMVKVRGANFKFDMIWMEQRWGIKDFKSFSMDTTLVGSLLDENRSNSLNLHAKVSSTIGGYDDPFNQTVDKSKMDEALANDPDGFLVYAGGDTDACLQVSNNFGKELYCNNKAQYNFYDKLLHKAAVAFRVIEQRGMTVARSRYDELRAELLPEIAAQHEIALRQIGRALLVTIDPNPDNWELSKKDKFISPFLFGQGGLALKPTRTTATGKPQITVDHIKELLSLLGDKAPERFTKFADAYFKYAKASKVLQTYVDGFSRYICDDDKFHPSYFLHKGAAEGSKVGGTLTGRTSATDPAVQTIPKHDPVWTKKLRSCFTVPEGYIPVNGDYSQGELRIAACVSNDSNMIQSYLDGIDLHTATAAHLNGYTLEAFFALDKKEQKRMRTGAKAANFGLLYGMQTNGYRVYAKNTYGLDLTDEEAQADRDKFFGTYSALLPWHSSCTTFAHKNGYVISPLGRKRHLPLINSPDWKIKSKEERQAINSVVQSTLSDLGLLAAGRINELYPELWCMGFTHDALSFYIKRDELHIWLPRIKEIMEDQAYLNEHFDWYPQVPFTVDFEVGTNSMGDMVEIEDYDSYLKELTDD